MWFKITTIDNEEYIKVSDILCAQRAYEAGKAYVGPRSAWYKVPFEMCNKTIGQTPDEYGEFQAWMEETRRALNNVRRNASSSSPLQ